MLRNIIVSVLICSVCVMHMESLKMDSEEDLLDDDNLVEELSIPQADINVSCPYCLMCTHIMKDVRAHLSYKANRKAIETQLHYACNYIMFFENECKRMVNEFMGEFIKELQTKDAPKTICKITGICKSITAIMDFIQDVQHDSPKL